MAYPQGGGGMRRKIDSSSRLDKNSRFCLAEAVAVFFFFWVPRGAGTTAAGTTAAFFTFFFFFIGTRGEKGSLEVFAMGDRRGSGKEVGR